MVYITAFILPLPLDLGDTISENLKLKWNTNKPRFHSKETIWCCPLLVVILGSTRAPAGCGILNNRTHMSGTRNMSVTILYMGVQSLYVKTISCTSKKYFSLNIFFFKYSYHLDPVPLPEICYFAEVLNTNWFGHTTLSQATLVLDTNKCRWSALLARTLPFLINAVLGPIGKEVSHPNKCSVWLYKQGHFPS